MNRSRDWTCPQCKQKNLDLLPDLVEEAKSTTTAVDEGSKQAHHETSETTRSNILSSSNATTQSHIALPTFQSTTVQSVEGVSTTGPPLALTAPPTPARNIPFMGMGSNSVPLSEPAEAKSVSSIHPPNRPGQREVAPMGPHERQTEDHPQLQVQAFPAFRDSHIEGVPRWLDSAILILSVLLGGIMIHRVMF